MACLPPTSYAAKMFITELTRAIKFPASTARAGFKYCTLVTFIKKSLTWSDDILRFLWEPSFNCVTLWSRIVVCVVR